MNPIEIEGATRVFTAPTNFSEPCGDLHIRDVMDGELPIMYSAWRPTMEQISRMLMGAPVILGVVGNVHPVVCLNVGEQAGDA